jgi:hypothetical protein
MADSTSSTSLSLSLVAPWLLTLLTFAGGIWQFTATQRQANRQPFLQKQLELCFQASEAASRLASETDPAEWERARLTFWRLYWGPLSVVEDRAVEGAMVALGRHVPKEPVASPKLPMKELGEPSYELAHAIRNLVLTSWQVDLPPLQQERSGAP